MPRPVDSGQRYMPGLDGLRALAVLAVIAYHEQFGWAPGGLLGVGVFFTLSGFLITSILVSQWSLIGKIKLGDFWLHRARRLLPALFVMLAVVTAWVTLADRARLAGLRGAVGASAAYFSNWYIIAKNQSYFARFAPPGPLDHLWSLAVEEQFYLLWPLLLVAGLLLLRKWHVSTAWLMLPAGLAAAGSAVAMLLLYQPGMDPTRVYEGTDTRAFGLLIGAMLALAWPVDGKRSAHSTPAKPPDKTPAKTPAKPPAKPPAKTPRLLARRLPGIALDVLGAAGLGAIGVMIWKVGEYSQFAYRGGLVLLSVATVAVVAATAYPGSVVGAALGWRPLRWIGVRSYGIYLWHYPVIVMTTPANTKPSLPTAALQIAASILLAALSWKLIEEPIRHGAIGRAWAKVRLAGWRRTLRQVNLPGLAATTGTVAVVVVAAAGLSGFVRSGAGSRVSSVLSEGSLQLPVTKTVVKAPKRQAGSGASPSPAAIVPGGTAASGPLRTSCRAVAHIGDSTSDGLISRDYLPKPRERITAQYEDVGVGSVVTDISGARSVVEVLPGQINGYDAMRNITRGGFRGCWVIALGTNDTADVAAGSNIGLTTRIGRVMKAAHGEPVMWVNVKSLLGSGPYAEANMARWDATLLKECPKYPNMRVYNWAAEVRRKWYISDGIHFTSIGYKHRAKMIAEALASAFPSTGQSSGCEVSS